MGNLQYLGPSGAVAFLASHHFRTEQAKIVRCTRQTLTSIHRSYYRDRASAWLRATEERCVVMMTREADLKIPKFPACLNVFSENRLSKIPF